MPSTLVPPSMIEPSRGSRCPDRSRRRRALRYAVPISWALFVGVNLLSERLFPQTVADLPQRGPALLIEPAAPAFAIWGLIFAGLGVGAAYQALPGLKNEATLSAIRLPLVASFACGALWPVAVGYDRIATACALLFGMLGSAAVAYTRLNQDGKSPQRAECVALRWPLSLYMGWLSLAGIISIASLLTADLGVSVNALGIPQIAWAGIGIGIASTVGVALGATRRDWAYTAAIAWGFAGVAAAQPNATLWGLLAAGITAMALGLGVGWWGARRSG